MTQLKAYHRPATVAEALQLLSRPGVNTTVIGGGTVVVPRLAEIEADEVVDLQHVGLTQLRIADNALTLGAMVRVQTLVDDTRLPSLLREAAHRAGPNTLRSAATIGGAVVGAESESELLAALLVFEALVHVQTVTGAAAIPLAQLWADLPAALDNGLVTSITMQMTGRTASARVARTPADSPIVAAVARHTGEHVLLALCGVADTPILVDPAHLEAMIHPPDDFRGSSTYRRQMAITLSRRVIKQVSDMTGGRNTS